MLIAYVVTLGAKQGASIGTLNIQYTYPYLMYVVCTTYSLRLVWQAGRFGRWHGDIATYSTYLHMKNGREGDGWT